MPYNTGNPLGSSDARDLFDNAAALDQAMNSTGPTWTDRLGVIRPTFSGAESELNALVADAAASAAEAAATADSLDDRWLGAKASDPATDNDGNALQIGAGYYNTTLAAFRIYGNTGWYTPNVDGQALAEPSGAGQIGFSHTPEAPDGTVGAKLQQIISVKDEPYGAVGDGVTDDTTAIEDAAAAIQAAGGGTLRLTKGTYSVAPTKGLLADYPDETAWITFTGLTGVIIDASEAIIADANTYQTTECSILFKFVDCVGVKVNIAKVTSAYGSTSGSTWSTSEGLHTLRFAGACSHIDISAHISGGSDAVRFQALSSDAEADKTRHIRAFLKTYRVRNPFVCAFAGSDAEAHIDAEGCGRNFHLYGVKNHRIKVRSKNQKIASSIVAYDGIGCTNIDVNAYDKDSDACNSAAPFIEIVYGDSTPAEMNDIKIHVDVKNSATAPFNQTLTIKKYLDGASTPDTTGRGHVLDGFKLSGNSYQVSTKQHFAEFTGGGEFATPDVVRNFSIENFSGLNSGDIILTKTLACLDGQAVLSNVYCNENIRLIGNTTGQIVMVGCDAEELSNATNDTSLINYVGCNIRTGTIQSFTNKSFQNTRLAGFMLGDGQQYNPINCLTATKLLTGNLTGTNNIFRFKDTTAGVYFRLRYYLVADRTDTAAGTRDETFGIKSFSASHNSSGVWTAYAAAADEVTEKTLGTASALTVSLVNGDATNGGYIAVACTNYNGANARGMFVLEAIPAKFNAAEVPVLVAL